MIFIQNIVHLEVIRQNPRTVQLAILWAGNRRLVLFWQGQDFCIRSIPVTSGAHLASYTRGTVEGGSSPRVRRPWRETGHSPPPSLRMSGVRLRYHRDKSTLTTNGHISNNIGGSSCQVDYLVRTNVKRFQYNSDTPRFPCSRVMLTATQFYLHRRFYTPVIKPTFRFQR